MRIEHVQHARNRRLKDGVVIKLAAVDIVILNYGQSFIQIGLNNSGSDNWFVSRRGAAGRAVGGGARLASG